MPFLELFIVYVVYIMFGPVLDINFLFLSFQVQRQPKDEQYVIACNYRYMCCQQIKLAA